MDIYDKQYILTYHTHAPEEIEGGALSQPYLQEREYKDGTKYYNKIPFTDYKKHKISENLPYPLLTANYTEDDAILSFIQLKLENVSGTSVFDYPVGKTTGNDATNYFMEPLRIEVKNASGISRADMWRDKELRKKVYETAYQLRFYQLIEKGKYDHKQPHLNFQHLTGVQLRPAMEMSIGAQNQFKPYIAKVIYNYFRDSIGANGTVLDFSAGWGGRCLGALASDLNYIGVDSNTDLIQPYERMLNLYKPYYKTSATLFFTQAENVDYSKLKYDFVLTSPPYLVPKKTKKSKGTQVEAYANMKDYSQMSFYEEFLIPTIANIMEHLPLQKWLCINTYKNNIDVLIDTTLGTPDLEFPYDTKARAGRKKNDYTEFCYCWKKTERLMNKIRIAVKKMKINTEGYKEASGIKSISVQGSGTKIGDEKTIEKKLKSERRQRRKGEEKDEEADEDVDEPEVKYIPFVAETTTVNTPVIPSIMPSKATNTSVDNVDKPFKTFQTEDELFTAMRTAFKRGYTHARNRDANASVSKPVGKRSTDL